MNWSADAEIFVDSVRETSTGSPFDEDGGFITRPLVTESVIGADMLDCHLIMTFWQVVALDGGRNWKGVAEGEGEAEVEDV